jgi:hypothetical protein
MMKKGFAITWSDCVVGVGGEFFSFRACEQVDLQVFGWLCPSAQDRGEELDRQANRLAGDSVRLRRKIQGRERTRIWGEQSNESPLLTNY